MALKITTLAQQKDNVMPMHRLKERTYANADYTKAVPGTHPDAAFLVGIEGDDIDEKLAKQLGLLEEPKKIATKAVHADEIEDKQVKKK